VLLCKTRKVSQIRPPEADATEPAAALRNAPQPRKRRDLIGITDVVGGSRKMAWRRVRQRPRRFTEEAFVEAAQASASVP
jgi:hypothetical protein